MDDVAAKRPSEERLADVMSSVCPDNEAEHIPVSVIQIFATLSTLQHNQVD